MFHNIARSFFYKRALYSGKYLINYRSLPKQLQYTNSNIAKFSRIDSKPLCIKITRSSKRSSEKKNVTVQDLLSLTPHDVEKELHRIKREFSGAFAEADYENALSYASDLELKISAVLGKRSAAYASAVNNMALAMKMLGRYEEALDNYTVAVQTYLEAVGEKHISYTYALANLGVAYKEAGEKKKGLEKLDMLDRAYEALTDAYKIRVDIAAPVSDIITSRNLLASVKVAKGQHVEAVQLLRESLAQTREHSDFKTLLLATTLNNLAYALKCSAASKTSGGENLLDEAQTLYEEALSIRRELLGVGHHDTIISMHNLAELHIAQGKTEEAARIQEAIIAQVEAKANAETGKINCDS